MSDPGIASEPLGPKAAAEVAIEVEAIPDDGTAAGASSAPGAAPAPDENIAAWDEAITFALTIGTRMASDRWPAMTTSREEIAAVSDAWSPICARRWPLALTPELVACLVTLAVFGPKVEGAFVEEKERRAKAKATARPAQSDSGLSST